FLELEDIYNLDLAANLVVLSGCETALGKEVDGESLVGLTHGFMYAGASSVLASLWKVDDYATSKLMKNFYEGMEGHGFRPATADERADSPLDRPARQIEEAQDVAGIVTGYARGNARMIRHEANEIRSYPHTYPSAHLEDITDNGTSTTQQDDYKLSRKKLSR